MGRKSKEGSVNLYYLKNENEKKDKSVSKKKKATKKKGNYKKTVKINDDKFNFDNEIVIGVTKKTDNKLQNQNKPKSKKKKNNSPKSKTVQVQRKNSNKKEKKAKNLKLFKYLFIICALLGAIVYFMLSPIFNIQQIDIKGNNIVSSEEIISLSEIKVGENIYKISKKNVMSKIKQNAYIESVEVKRKIPSTLEINVKERQATYMLEYANSYAYINNQGYMLEITNEKIDRPIITGIITMSEDIKEGNRLVEEDLIKLENVLKIMESATSNEIERLITKIDITNKTNYLLYMETEGKIVKLGDITDISTKMLHVKAIVEKEAGIQGEIIVDSVSKDSESRFIQKIN